MILLQRALFGIVASFWLVTGALAAFGVIDPLPRSTCFFTMMVAGALSAFGVIDFGLTSGARVLGILMLRNGAALGLAGWRSLRGQRLIDCASLAVVGVNALLSVTDEIGLLDVLSLLVSVALLVLLIVNMRRRSRARDLS